MKYLGILLDSRWKFLEHFQGLGPKLIRTAGALCRVLPNKGGPNNSCRRLYAGVVKSMALYGAPVWADALTTQCKTLLRRTQRVMAVRAIRGYRTISYEAACALAAYLPWDLEAKVLAGVYRLRIGSQIQDSNSVSQDNVRRWRQEAHDAALNEWQIRLAHPTAGHLTIAAVRPILKKWVQRKFGTITFRLVQILSGHGCFGKYLHKIAGKETNSSCHSCGCIEDTAQHTLEVCPAWASERSALRAIIGFDLSLPAVVKAMVSSERSWTAVTSFCESIMSQKEAAERLRENNPLSDACRRRRPGRRRQAYADLMPP